MSEETAPVEKVSFETWWKRFLHCAEEASFEINPDESEMYREYYDDGDSPEEAIDNEIEAFEAVNGDWEKNESTN